jgi:competence protein ComEA
MATDKLNRLWLLATGILTLIILVGSLLIWLGRDKGQEVILISPENQTILPGNVIIEGAVANPGSFPLRVNDTLHDLVDAAGGFSQNADSSNIKIIVPQKGDSSIAQQIDINRADIWLLQALPGIGEVRAQAIVDFRTQNGPFKNIEEMMNVPGLSQAIFDKLKAFITISG